MGKKKNKNVNVVPDTYIEADPVEASEEARKSGDTVPESALGKKLASADKKVRDKAVLVLANWLSKQSSLSEDDHLKIWKALYYCFWMSDKPPVQNELAEKMAEFIHKFPTLEQSVLFFRTFFKTMDREWPGIDKLRLNKFYYLVRCFQRESLIYMAKSNWDDDVVDAFNVVLVEGPLSCEAKCTDLKLHLADLFLDELANSGTFDSGFSSDILMKLLEPYFQLVVRAKDKSVFERGFSRIFESLAGERWLAGSLQDADKVDPSKLQPLRHANRMFRHTYIEPVPLRDVCQLCLDRDFASEASLKVTARIFSFTVKKSTPEFVRKRFYDLLDEYSELCSGLGQPFDGDVDAVSDDDEGGMAADDAGEEVEEAVQPKRGKKGRAAEEPEDPEPAASKGKKRLSWEAASGGSDAGRGEKRPRKERDAPAAEKGGRAGKDAIVKRKKAAARAQEEHEAEAEAEAEAEQVPEPAAKGRRGKARGGKGVEAGAAGQADGRAGKRRPEPAAQEPDDAAGAVRLTVEERRGVRSRVATLAAASMSESALTAAPTISPRKHALTAADFFKSAVAPPGRAAESAKSPLAPSRPAGGGKRAAKGTKRGAAAAHTE